MKYIFAIAIYIGAGGVMSNAMVNPSPDTIVAAVVAMYAVLAMLNERLNISALESASKALAAARKELADQNIMLRATREAIDANDLEPLRRYWRGRNNSG